MLRAALPPWPPEVDPPANPEAADRVRMARGLALRWVTARDLSLRKLFFRNIQIGLAAICANWLPALWAEDHPEPSALLLLLLVLPLAVSVWREREVRWLREAWQAVPSGGEDAEPDPGQRQASWNRVSAEVDKHARTGRLSARRMGARRLAWAVVALVALAWNASLLVAGVREETDPSLRWWFTSVHLLLLTTAAWWLRRALRPVPRPKPHHMDRGA
ncbi:hypothetical protein [Streptomyces sp. NPDC127098]|uniref:hypothetical protein n=1 Tax=Streptomyces sp. NPDC127098 TaxID=3347137 RepID=UPI003663DA71